MAVRTQARLEVDESLVSRFGVRWGVRPWQLQAPLPRDADVPRPGLIERIRSSSAALVTVAAPPGYGKTTFAAAYVGLDPRRSAWLSIDGDGDAVTLARALTLALSPLLPIDDTLLQELTSARPRHSMLVAGLSTSVRNAPDRFLLVLDDLHHLMDPAEIDLVMAIVDETPRGSQVVLVSQSFRAFSLAGVRAHDELLELGAEDLRFGIDDAERLLRSAGVTDLSREEVAALTEQTEGWAVGLYLAALSHASGGPGDAAPSFGGDDRFVADYMRENVLAQLPEDDVDFLIRTSLLEEMTGPLCDAILETTSAGVRLEALEASNLLVVPLDHRRERFRYHHLFRDLLRHELGHRSPELIPVLAARASTWCETEGALDLAVSYAQEGNLTGRVAELIARYGQMAYFTGRADAVLRWFRWLDDHCAIEDHPFVAALGGWAMAMEGRLFDAERWVDAASRSTVTGGDEGEACRLLLLAAMCRDGAQSMREDMERALAILPAMSTWLPNARLVAGLADVLAGDSEAAEGSFRASAELSAGMGTAPASTVALAELAILALARGDVEGAATHAHAARQVIDEGQLHGYATSVLTYAVAARVAVIQGDPVRARRFTQDAADHRALLTVALPTLALQVRIQLLRTALALVDLDRAEAYLEEADDILGACSDLGALADELEAARKQVELLRSSRRGIQPLTPAEARLLPLLTTYLSFREIGEQLFVSPHTVKTQAISIYRKLGVTSRASAVDTARQIGLLVEAHP